MLEAKNLHKVYTDGTRRLHVLKGINLHVEKGEVLCIAGPSGAGKSTLLHLLGGLDYPTQGEVFFEGLNLYQMKDAQRARIRNKRIGFVFQLYYLLGEFTALENVMLPALIDDQGKSRHLIQEQALNLLSEVGLRERITHKPSQLSGGEQQRVAIARALMQEPEIIFCDEPTGNLDSKGGSQIFDLLWRLNEMKKQTLVIVTHDREIAQRANRTLLIKDGLLVG